MSFEEVPPSGNSAQASSNFAHVIFQNVAKSYLPNASLECHYTLTSFLKPHPKDWVGIFKVGWNTARDYYTFLWSPTPDNYVEGSSFDCVVCFQGYYLPNDDGEFYQFCYVTHKGEIRGASTPFQFRTASPVEELLTMEDEGSSDMLVVTTRAGFLEQKIEKALKEKEELLLLKTAMEEESTQLRETVKILEKKLTQEKENYEMILQDYKSQVMVLEGLGAEKQELQVKCDGFSSRVLQLENDLATISQKIIEKETEIYSLKDQLKKAMLEKEQLECLLKNEKDEKELYKIHLKQTEIENTQLVSEIQTLKKLGASNEGLLVHYKDEVGRLQLCIAEKEKMRKDVVCASSTVESVEQLKEQLRVAEDIIQASKQEASLMAKELGDVANVRDKTMAELHNARLENDALKKKLSEVEAVNKAREKFGQLATSSTTKQEVTDATTEQELRREVEDLKLRLRMAGEHYKEKYKECQKLQKQVNKLTEQAEMKTLEQSQQNMKLGEVNSALTSTVPLFNATPPSTPVSSSSIYEMMVKEQVQEMSKDVAEKTEKYKKCKQMLSEEKEKCRSLTDELNKSTVKLKMYMKLNDDLKLQLAVKEDQYKSQMAEKDCKINQLATKLETLTKDIEKVDLSKGQVLKLENPFEQVKEGQSSQAPLSQAPQQPFLYYRNPYCQDVGLSPEERDQSRLLQFGNPYVAQHRRDGADGAFYPDEVQRPPIEPPSWRLDGSVVCNQPSRNLSRPDGLEDPENSNDEDENVLATEQVTDPPKFLLHERGTGFCFDSSFDILKKCPICEVLFPPNYDQTKFEEHVESHWKMCPMCSEQFPPDCEQEVFERHVQTHFDGNVLNFES
ncbi:tax1-binding protein 1 [Protopterus annectens]|uniref:tax1-binding protein 1 n=1 Tax=Protopterus annectens TaxID=7888 RepID=UPI001CF9F14D|nr:tax1-binding protein 1 [Protopterus annectens]